VESTVASRDGDFEVEISRAFESVQPVVGSRSTRIFVSYTLRDGALGEGALRTLEQQLLNFGAVYIDLLHNFDPEPQRRVERELEAATLFALCATPRALLSEWVRFEIETATRRCLPVVRLRYLAERWVAVVDCNLPNVHRSQVERVSGTRFNSDSPSRPADYD
jgi:hypothetical protein